MMELTNFAPATSLFPEDMYEESTFSELESSTVSENLKESVSSGTFSFGASLWHARQISNSEYACEVNWHSAAQVATFENEQLLSLYQVEGLSDSNWKDVKFRFKPVGGDGRAVEHEYQVKKHNINEYYYFDFREASLEKKLLLGTPDLSQYCIAMNRSSKILRYLEPENDVKQVVPMSCNRLIATSQFPSKLGLSFKCYQFEGCFFYYAFSNSNSDNPEGGLVTEFTCRIKSSTAVSQNKSFIAYGIVTLEAVPYVIKTEQPKVIFFDVDEMLIVGDVVHGSYSFTEENIDFMLNKFRREYVKTKFVVLSNGGDPVKKLKQAYASFNQKKYFDEIIDINTPEYTKFRIDKGEKIKHYCEKNNIDIVDPKNEIVLIDDHLPCHQDLSNALPKAQITHIHYIRCPEEKRLVFKAVTELNESDNAFINSKIIEEVRFIEKLKSEIDKFQTKCNSYPVSTRGMVRIG